MTFRAAECPACHKTIQVPTDTDQAVCMYCGHKMATNEAAHSAGASISNLMGMGRSALLADNHEEALGYFNRVLELDPSIAEAWIGKGKAAGWQSTLANMRLGEVVVAFQHAIAAAPDESKEATRLQVLAEANSLAGLLQQASRNHLMEYVAVADAWSDHLNRSAQVLDMLDRVRAWLPSHRPTLENIISICKDNLEGVSYRDPFDNNLPKAWTVTGPYEALLRTRLDESVQALRAIDPSFAAPTVEKKQPDSCFVVTATMGNPDHPKVQIMRRFRDEWITKQDWGPSFISSYYRHGPKLAGIIDGHAWLRRPSYWLIVTPAAWLARRTLKARR